MGTYLGDCDDAEDARYVTVLSEGLKHGLNLVDTAINYRCQRSERAVGEAIRKAVDVGVAKRDEIVVATKGGFIPLEGSPPESRALYEKYLTSEYYDKGIITAADVVAGGHSLNPNFLANQSGAALRISASRQ
jgi:aryl-alcohol dehydrogenase-like predicted oxidoreductase